MNDIQQLNEEFNKIGESDNLGMVKYYESNNDSIDNIDIDSDIEHYNTKLRLQGEYGLSLVSSGHPSPAVAVLAKSMQMFENSPTIDNDTLHEFNYYQHLKWNYGLALYRSNQKSKATEIFKSLVHDYPKNEMYFAWLIQLKEEKINKITRPFWIICGIWLIGELTFFEKLDQNIQFTLSIIGFLFLVPVVISELYLYTLKKKN